jgi:hypothetical protein
MKVASDKDTIATAMTADKVFPQLSQEIRYVNLFATEMAQYVDEADSECTMIAPDNTVRAKAQHNISLQSTPGTNTAACEQPSSAFSKATMYSRQI